MATELVSPNKRNRTRSPSYPYLDLPSALEKAAALWQAEGRHATSVSVAMQHWGYKEDSSTGYSCVAALKKFGLVEQEGMGEARQMRLSDLALRILLDGDPQSAERRMALREAALAPRIHAELWERYAHDLPSDQSLKRFLVLERSFNEASVDELLAEYKATVAYAGLSLRTNGDPGPTAPRLSAPPAQSAPAAVQLAPAALLGGQEPPRVTPAVNERPARVLPPRAVGPQAATPPATARTATPAVPQGDFFDEEEEAAYRDDERYAGEALSAARRAPAAGPSRPPAPAAPEPAENNGPWSLPRRELPVPLDNGLVASVPYPMTEEDFTLLLDTLQLWKKRLVQPAPR